MADRIKTFSYGGVNAYLICGSGGSILVDTGTYPYKEKILAACKGKAVRLIVLTHGHFDHCQNAAYLSRELGCPIGISREDFPLLEQGQKRKVNGRGIWGHIYAWASNLNIRHKRIEAVKADIILENKMSLLEYGIGGEIIMLPGHTRGSVGVLLKTGEMFVGDAMQNYLFPSAAWCFEDEENVRKSVELIRTVNASEIYYGHGRATRNK